jgi:hypothetical protein
MNIGKLPISGLLLSLITLSFCFSSNAQVRNTGNLRIHPGAEMNVVGDFTDTLSAVTTINGIFHSKGNFYSYASSAMPSITGSIIFDGTSAQVLKSNAGISTDTFQINNGNTVTLQTRLTINGFVNFTSGKIASTASNDLYFAAGSSYSGYSSSSYVNGYVSKAGTTSFTFPLGARNNTASFAISNFTGTSSVFQAFLSDTGYNVYGPIDATLSGSRSIWDKQYWKLTRSSGSAQVSASLAWNDALNVLNHSSPTALRVAYYNGSTWTSVGGSGAADASTGTVGTSALLSSYGVFTIGSVSSSVPLPVELLSFDASYDASNKLVNLDWSTALEVNNDHFSIQRSNDGQHWNELLYAAGAGNSTITHQYHQVDLSPLAGTSYYRLAQYDYDGTEKLSEIKSITTPISDNQIVVYPTVSNGQFVARTTTVMNDELMVYSMNGAFLSNASMHLAEGENNIDLSFLSSGSYLLAWKNNSAKTVQIVINK